jgi:hypothetical protein
MLAGSVTMTRDSGGVRVAIASPDGCANRGETITLTAAAPANFRLAGWLGDAGELCDAAAGTCTIRNLSRDLVVAADFRIQSFVHPGLLSTASDLARMRAAVAAHSVPVYDDYQILTQASHGFAPTPAELDAGARITYAARPQQKVCRGDSCSSVNAQYLWWDINAAQSYVYMWKMTGRREYADAAVQILNAWSGTLKSLDGYFDGFLVAGIQGYQLCVLGELLRDYDGWAPADFKAFKTMVRSVFVDWSQWFIGMNRIGLSTDRVYASWDLAMENCLLAYAVLADDVDTFNWVQDFYVRGGTNGSLANFAYYRHPGNLVQTQESGRDQGHNTLSIMLATNLAEMAWNQGVDFYGWDNNRLLGAAEYVAKANLMNPATQAAYVVPFVYWQNLHWQDAENGFSTDALGLLRPEWTVVHEHYVKRKGLSAPYTEAMMKLVGNETGPGGNASGGYDGLGYGTFLYTKPAAWQPLAIAPVLTGKARAGKAALDWWGSAGARRYDVLRSPSSGGPYIVVASGVTDLLTYVDQPQVPGTYYYTVVGQDNVGNTTARSNEVAVAVGGTRLLATLGFDTDTTPYEHDAANGRVVGRLVGAAKRVAGKKGKAVDLDGASGYVELPDEILRNAGDFSFAAWVYWRGGSHNRIFDIGINSTRYLYLTPGTGEGRVMAAISLYSYAYEPQSGVVGGSLKQNEWHHVAVTLSGTPCADSSASTCPAGKGGSTMTLYVDGKQAVRTDGILFAPADIGYTRNNTLGRSQYGSDALFNGMLDDVRFYDGALSATEVATLYQQ